MVRLILSIGVYVVVIGSLVVSAMFVSGCSMKMEFGYHGLTGRDDRTQTQLVNSEQPRKDERRY